MTRNRSIDALRGVAILLMVASHAAWAVDVTAVNATVGRLAMPLFLVVSGWCVSTGRYRWDRWWLVVAAAVLSHYPLYLITGVSVGILYVWILVHPVLWCGQRYWPVLLVAGLLQPWVLPLSWSGYQPGELMLWGAVGVGVRDLRLPVWFWSPRWLVDIGCSPVLWYVAHVYAGSAIAIFFTKMG